MTKSKKGGSDVMIGKLDNLQFSRTRTMELNEQTAYLYTALESLLQNKEIIKWAELLCEAGNVKEFIAILDASKSELLAIMEYREILYRRNKEISFIELNTAYTNDQFDKLHILLERMFLEPITTKQFEFILNKIDSVRDGIEELYNRHVEDKGLRALSVALTL